MNDTTAASEKSPGRERQQYRLNEVITFQREELGATDTALEDLLTTLELAIRDDGVIDTVEQQEIFLAAQTAYKSNAAALTTTTLLDVSGSEAALREIDRVRSKRQARARHVRTNGSPGARR